MADDLEPTDEIDSRHEPAEAGDDAVRDELPADLQPGMVEAPYLFPNNSRRKIPAALYAVIGLGCIALYATAGDEPVLINNGTLIAGVVLIIVAAYHWQGGWDLSFDEEQALGAATKEVGFPIGHASAQLGWRGLRSRPTWRILLYSNESIPEHRGLVLVDGVDGEIIDRFIEKNPEDWSAYTS